MLDWLRSRTEALTSEVCRLVEQESPSHDKAAVDQLGRMLAGRFRGLGAVVRLIENQTGGDPVMGELPGAEGAPPALVLGHHDTVWPVGTLARMPIREEEGRLYGPGVFDMKANLVVFAAACEAVAALGLGFPRPIRFLFSSDEEIGSPSSRPVVEAAAAGAAYVLVLEPPLADGSLKTARKGVGQFTLEVRGRSAHAGVEPERGASAIVELAHLLIQLQSLNNPAAGITLNVGLIEGGTAVNVVPESARARLDIRVATTAAAAAVERSLASLPTTIPGTSFTVSGSFNRPPMERTPQIARLFENARVLARRLDRELTEGSTGGGSDGNFTAALGIPTLDGLGVRGGGAHAADEHIEIASLPEQAALLALLLLNL